MVFPTTCVQGGRLWVGTSSEGIDGPAGRMAATEAAVTRQVIAQLVDGHPVDAGRPLVAPDTRQRVRGQCGAPIKQEIDAQRREGPAVRDSSESYEGRLRTFQSPVTLSAAAEKPCSESK